MSNKYFIGYHVPYDTCQVLRELQTRLVAKKFTDVSQMHITALYIGEASLMKAQNIIEKMSLEYAPAQLSLGHFKVFGSRHDHLVVSVVDDGTLAKINSRLAEISNQRKGMWSYEPHVTIAVGCASIDDSPVPAEAFIVNQLVLYEKPEGGEYQPIIIRDFNALPQSTR